MIIYIDENLPPQLAEGLNKLQFPLNKKNRTDYEIKSIKSVFGEGVKDEEWIPIAGEQNSIAITKDYKIQTTRHQRMLCEDYGLGVFFFCMPSSGLQYWQIVRAIIEKWEPILKCAEAQEPPYAYRFNIRSSKIERLNDD